MADQPEINPVVRRSRGRESFLGGILGAGGAFMLGGILFPDFAGSVGIILLLPACIVLGAPVGMLVANRLFRVAPLEFHNGVATTERGVARRRPRWAPLLTIVLVIMVVYPAAAIVAVLPAIFLGEWGYVVGLIALMVLGASRTPRLTNRILAALYANSTSGT